MIKKILIVYALFISLVAVWGVGQHREAERLDNNVTVLTEEVALYRTRLDESAASVRALQLRCDEFRRMRVRDAQRIRELGIKLKRVESVSAVASETNMDIELPLRDSTILGDKVSAFRWHDPWVRVEGLIRNDSVRCHIKCVDTLRQVVHRVPRRFLFIKYGTKAIRQEITSSNPHTQIVYAEYIELKKSRKRKK